MTEIPTSSSYFKSNPILGSSEGEQRSKNLKEKYAKFIRHNVKEIHMKKSRDKYMQEQQKKNGRKHVHNLMQGRNEAIYSPIEGHNVTPAKGNFTYSDLYR
jgi:hypothetical protein